MKKLLLIALLCTAPAFADDLTRSNIPNMQMYSVTPLPGTSEHVIQYSTTECHPPEQLLGKSVDELNGIKFNQPVRILRPGQMKTMDFAPNRLNFGLDEQGIIRAISCG